MPKSAPLSWRDAARQPLRQDLATFCGRAFAAVNPGETFTPSWHIYALCHALERAYAGEIRRLLITMPPRYLKSLCASVAFPAWALGQDPSLKFIVACYGGGLAQQHARDFRSVIAGNAFRLAFPDFAEPQRNTAEEFVTDQNGGRRAVSLGGTVTGLGADFIIADDLMKAGDANSSLERLRVQDFYTNTLASRLNDKRTGRIIVVQQRLHEDDLAGYLADKGGFTHLNLPAIAESAEVYDLGRRGEHRRTAGEPLCAAREPLDVLNRVRAEIGAAAFSAQYQQNPTPPDGQTLRWNKIATYEGAAPRNECIQIVQSWDTAVSDAPTAAFSVCTTWGHHDGAWKLLDVYRARLAFPDLLAKAKCMVQQWRPDLVLIEYASSGAALLQALRAEKESGANGRRFMCHYAPISPTQDKETRLAAGAALLEDRRAQFPIAAPWLEEFRRELTAFPASKFSDQVDSVSQFLAWAGGRRARARLGRAQAASTPARRI